MTRPRFFDMPELDCIDPCGCGDDDILPVPQVVGCAFGGGRSDELPEIPMSEAVETCHEIARQIEAMDN